VFPDSQEKLTGGGICCQFGLLCCFHFSAPLHYLVNFDARGTKELPLTNSAFMASIHEAISSRLSIIILIFKLYFTNSVVYSIEQCKTIFLGKF
jgi:hypothetical protein